MRRTTQARAGAEEKGVTWLTIITHYLWDFFWGCLRDFLGASLL